MPVKVLQVGMTRNWGGLETYLMQQFRQLDRNHVVYDFVNITGEYDIVFQDEILASGSRIYQVPSRHKSPFAHYCAWWRILREHAGEYHALVLNTNSLEYVFPLFAARIFGIPVRVIHSHNSGFENDMSLPRRLLVAVNTFLMNHSVTAYFACSNKAGKWMFPGKKFLVIHNAIDAAALSYDESTRRTVRTQMGLDHKLVLGHVGRFSYQKNHSFLLDIFAEVCKRHPETVLLLIGDAVGDTLYLDQTKEKADRLGLAEKVRFLGLRDDVPSLMQAMDCFLLPSYFEGLPLVGIEAQAAGLPCFVSDTVSQELGVTDLIQFLPLQTPEIWAGAILQGTAKLRRNTQSEIAAAGYDIATEIAAIQQFYQKEE